VTSDTGRHTPPPMPLAVLSRRVRAARSAVQLQRSGAANSPPLTDARHLLLVALEDYVTALEARGLPVPQGLRRELDSHRVLFD
jgi:hypothetical protein